MSQAVGQRLTMEQETKIVAMLARGDTRREISEEMEVSLRGVTQVKKRNKDNLRIIEERMLIKATEDALSIKRNANTKINQRLKRDDKIAKVLDKAYDEYLDGDITLKEFTEHARRIKELSMNELVSVSKAMHEQSPKEDKPVATSADLAALAAAIRSGDEVKITQAVFNAKPQIPPAEYL